ncbi:ATP-dependent zinc metalloprotease FtsH [Virgibacillus sp. YIM 98842]|uniref:ATP-dependent zinc metalloprotease FtsH n=1 Tax=Virgibacillus sp. YIM 98842 TaxID=2663533 RepID=UPI0013DAD577|nr:ATP-dependent zinc metalloprotease FtsH [Virgibacillus sp. YIM 98842]
MNKGQTPRRPIIYYVLFAVIIILALNAFVAPFFQQQQLEDVDYGTFLSMLEEGNVDEVEMTETSILYTLSGEENMVYQTGRVEDPGLVNRLYEAGAEFTQEIPTEVSPFFTIFLFMILPVLIFIIIGIFLSRSLRKRMGGDSSPMSFGKSKAKIYAESKSDVNFGDVAGQDEAKEALTEIIDFLHDPKKFQEIGAKLPKGALLVGPPGTGKTLMARAVAGEAKVPFFIISGSEFVEMFVGMGASRVRDLFKQAQEKAPCIVFIDEIDAIGKARDSRGVMGNDEREQTLNQLLNEMDGFDASKGVVILAATNRPEVLDKALLRAGRFDRQIPVELPDVNGRKAILQVHAKNIRLEQGIDFDVIARSTAGASGAELENIVNEAALRAVKMGRSKVAQEDLEASVDVVVAGYERKSAVISTHEKLVISYHEIGHALVAVNLEGTAPVQKITIIPRTSGALGFTMQVEEAEKFLYSKEDLLNKITVLTGGRAAEEIIFNSITTGASNDIEQATKLARQMVTRFGMSDNFGMMGMETVTNPYLGEDTVMQASSETSAKVDAEVQRIIKKAHEQARQILKSNMDKLHESAKYLLEKETITGDEFMKIVYDKKV